MHLFSARIEITGINPFVRVPDEILEKIFVEAQKNKSPIPVRGMVNDKAFRQTLVKYKGEWILYVNLKMLDKSTERIGEIIDVCVGYDPEIRTIEPHPKLLQALDDNADAKEVYESLTPSLRQEIVRYISFLKTEESIERNVARAVRFLLGKERFIGRDKP